MPHKYQQGVKRSIVMRFGGGHGRTPKLVQKYLGRATEGGWVGVSLWLVGKAGWGWDLSGSNLPLVPKEGSLAVFISPRWGTQGRDRLKSCEQWNIKKMHWSKWPVNDAHYYVSLPLVSRFYYTVLKEFGPNHVTNHRNWTYRCCLL